MKFIRKISAFLRTKAFLNTVMILFLTGIFVLACFNGNVGKPENSSVFSCILCYIYICLMFTYSFLFSKNRVFISAVTGFNVLALIFLIIGYIFQAKELSDTVISAIVIVPLLFDWPLLPINPLFEKIFGERVYLIAIYIFMLLCNLGFYWLGKRFFKNRCKNAADTSDSASLQS